MDEMFKRFKKEFGADAIFRGDDKGNPASIDDFIPTETFILEYVIGRPGLPLGRLTEVFGHFSTGKSSICAAVMGAITRAGHIGVLMDTEHAWSSAWMEMYGIKTDNLLIAQPKTVQQLFEQTAFLCNDAKTLIKKPQALIIVVDSVSAVPTAEEVEGDKEGMAMHAKLTSKGFRVLTNLLWENRVSIICVSQLKDNPMQPFSNSKLGGSALDFHAAVQIKMVRMQKTDTHLRLKMTAVKNKVARPFREVVFDLKFATGIDPTLPILQAGTEYKLIDEASGGWYTIGGKSYRAEEAAELIKKGVYERLLSQQPLQQPNELSDSTVKESGTENPQQVGTVVASNK